MQIFKKLLILLVFLLLFLPKANAQSKLSYDFSNVTLDSAISIIESDNNINVYYLSEWLQKRKVYDYFEGSTVEELLNSILSNFGLKAIKYSGNSYVLIKKLNDGQVVEERQNNGRIIRKVTVGGPNNKVKIATIKGHIYDVETKEPLIGATIYNKALKKGTASDANGYFEITLPVGEHTLEVSSLGYRKENQRVILQSSGKMDIVLLESKNTLKEVTILSNKIDSDISEGQMSLEELDVENIEYVPSLMGEKDIVKTITLLPGVVSGEGSSGYSVRGGGFGQNLIFLESTPLYNSSHLFGLFSVFNSGVVENLTIYKGTMPPRYGGRVASVMDVKLKEGQNQNWKGEAAVGVISSRLSLEGPITKKLSVLVGGRISYFNRFLQKIENPDIQNGQGSYYDANLKLSYALSENTTFAASGFTSFDEFTLVEGEHITYGNQLASTRWIQKFSKDLQGNFDVNYSTYFSTIESVDSTSQKFVRNSISTTTAKGYFTYLKIPRHQLNAGFEANYTLVDPGKITETTLIGTTESQINKESGIEAALFASDEFKISEKLSFNLGVRYSYFALVGPGIQYVFEPNMPKRSSTITDTLTYANGELIKSYGGIEPRFFLNYKINTSTNIKFNAGRSRQFLHLMSNTASVSPLNIWKFSNSNLKPQVADQMSIGLFKKFDKKLIEVSYEFFYRYINNIPDFKNGALLYNNPNLETQIVSGHNTAYGHEFQLSKNDGKLTGWLSYTFSRSFNYIDSEFEEEKINNGNKYPSNYDIPHSISVSGDYKLSRLWSLSFNWVYNSGRPITYPEAYYFHNGAKVAYYSARNEYRIPDYHRLDLSINLKGSSLRVDKRWDFNLSFSVYNVYGRKNAYSIFFQQSASTLVGKKLSIVAQPIPSLTLTIKLK